MDRRPAQAAGKRLTLSAFAASVAALLVAFSANAQSWRSDKPCGERQPPMTAADVKGCHRAWCSETVLGRLCACVKDDPDQTQFALEGSATARLAWSTPSIPQMGGDANHFRIDRIGDGQLLVAMMRSESVGIAVSTWIVWAIQRGKASRPLEVQNYGTFSFPTAAPAGSACHLLAARWHPGWEPRRGHGMYIAGSWYAIENGEFMRVENRPAIQQRYLSGVERARYDAEERNQPLLWYRSASAAIGPRPVTGKEP